MEDVVKEMSKNKKDQSIKEARLWRKRTKKKKPPKQK